MPDPNRWLDVGPCENCGHGFDFHVYALGLGPCTGEDGPCGCEAFTALAVGQYLKHADGA